MINSTPITKTFVSPPPDRREILRYMGCKTQNDEINALIDRSLDICCDALRYDTVSSSYSIKRDGDMLDLGFGTVQSGDLAKCLDGCEYIVLFAATLGIELDRLIARYGKTEPSVSVCLQAIGAERIEALCDAFCSQLRADAAQKGYTIRPRFSAGYGDLSLDHQRQIFSCLGCSKSIGLTLNDSLLMSPSKSVTAIVGIKKTEV